MRLRTTILILAVGTGAVGADLESPAHKHWAYQPVAAPQVSDATRPIDSFVRQRLAQAGLAMSDREERATLLRRLYVDLVGFPPSFREVETFVGDSSADAYTKVVDRLLGSEHFGERWARYWLDLARYSDTKGYVFEEERHFAYSYTYRDWVIRALNQDLPYDRFLKLQIAADHYVKGAANEDLAALGFLTLGRRFLKVEADIIEDRLDVIFRTTQATTVGCARCHDHKFDPIPTADYYSLYGVLASSMEPAELPLLPSGNRTPAVEKFEQELAGKNQKILDYKRERLQALFGAKALEKYIHKAVTVGTPDSEALKKQAKDEGLYLNVLREWMQLVEKGDARVFGLLREVRGIPPGEFEKTVAGFVNGEFGPPPYLPILIQRTRAAKPKNLAELVRVYAALIEDAKPLQQSRDQTLEPVQAAVISLTRFKPEEIVPFFIRSEREKLTKLVQDRDHLSAISPGAPPRAMVLVDKEQPVEPVIFTRGDSGKPGDAVPRRFLKMLSNSERQPFTKGSGRLELAEAIASRSNPLTARVLVNRVWGQLTGNLLVATPSDFGVRTSAPSNAALLEYLAAGFMERGWSVKSLVREIVLSDTYQQQSKLRPDAAAIDPGNELLWRMNRRRMDFEAMRDSMLEVTGSMDRTMFGKAVDLFKAPYAKRRSIYGFIDRQNLPGTFRTFDFANPDAHAPKRFETTSPQQALFFLNSPFLQELAQAFATPAVRLSSTEEEIRCVFRHILSRNPTVQEIEKALLFINQGGEMSALAQALLSTNEFLFVD